jgi:hypothetical protein
MEFHNQTFFDASLRLLHKFPNEKHGGCGAIAARVILRHRCPCNHDCRRVLDLLRKETNNFRNQRREY